MSSETLEWLNSQTLIGFVDERSHAWHYRVDLQSEESNHYPGAIPAEDVKRRLFNWDAVERDIYIMTDGDPEQIDGRKAIVRSDNNVVMGIFKEGYQPHQYEDWLINNVENLLDDSLQIGSAGLLRAGAVAWVQIEVPDSMKVNGVVFRPHITATTSFDGSLATTYLRGANLVVCDNTLSAALGAGDSSKLKFKHTKYSHVKLMDARSALEIVHNIGEAFTEQIETLCDIKVSEGDWEKFLNELVPVPEKDGRGKTVAENKQSELQVLYRHDDRCSEWQDTAFGVIQTVNTWQHHNATVRGGNGHKELVRAERNMERLVKGQVDVLDNETLKTLEGVLA